MSEVVVLTQDRLKELLLYDPETGVWLRLATGLPAGCSDDRGYLKIRVDGKRYYVGW